MCKFSKDVTVLTKWKEFCRSENIEEALLSRTNYLCSSHLLAEDYLHPVGSVRNKLCPGAVRRVHSSTNGKRIYAQIQEAAGNNCVSKHPKIDDRRELEDVERKCSSTRSAAAPDTPIDEINDIVIEDGDDIPPVTPPSHGYSIVDGDITVPNVSAYSNFEDNTITGESTSIEPGGQNPFFKEARYVGDIKSPHLATPRRAKRAVTLAKITIARQKSKILNLQQTTRHLKKYITTLKDVVQHLKQKN